MAEPETANRAYHLPEGVWLSWYSRPFYRTAAAWRGRIFLYLLLLVGASLIPDFVRMQAGLRQGISELRQSIAAGKVPVVEISDGEARTPEPRPYVVPLSEKARMLIDTTGKTTTLEGTDFAALLTKSRLYVRQSKSGIQTYDLSNIKQMTIDQAWVNRWIARLERWMPVAVFPVLLLIVFSGRLIEAALLMVLGLVLGQWNESRLPARVLFNVAVIAMTPALVTETLLDAYVGSFTGRSWVTMALTFGYLIFAVNTVANPSSQDDAV